MRHGRVVGRRGGRFRARHGLLDCVSSYLLSNAAAQTGARFDALARTYDPASTRALTAAGIGPGWRCWEVGGGGGTIAAWLADRVGPTGSVLVTDIDPRWMGGLTGRANVVLRQHDVVHDELPAGEFDLVHARLVLLHLPRRHLVLDRLTSCLRPGGRLVVEDFDCTGPLVLTTPSRPGAEEIFEMVHGAFTDEQRTGVFKPEVPVGDDASPQEKLLAFTGRRPG